MSLYTHIDPVAASYKCPRVSFHIVLWRHGSTRGKHTPGAPHTGSTGSQWSWLLTLFTPGIKSDLGSDLKLKASTSGVIAHQFVLRNPCLYINLFNNGTVLYTSMCWATLSAAHFSRIHSNNHAKWQTTGLHLFASGVGEWDLIAVVTGDLLLMQGVNAQT